MATPGATIADRITDLIGSEYATIPSLSYVDLINAAFNEVADMMSVEELLKYSDTPTNVTSASGVSIEDKKILKVIRVDANSNGVDKECQFKEQTSYSIASDSNSIYKATAFSPIYTVYSLNNASTVLIHPDCNSSGQVGRIWSFAYATNSTNLTAITAATLNTSHFMPTSSIHAIVLKSCINILNTYLGEQVQEEEDIEMMQMIQNQIQGLEKAFLQEMQRFTEKTEEVKGE
tara:strand:+ start:231 stop:929 length:699 start_codon:yes stop_codon:yes gene_type:complete